MKKLVIYTCVSGNYDKIADPEVVVPWADYICFSSKRIDSSVWQWRPIEESELPEAVLRTPTLVSRWYKLRPELYFPEYEYSLWIDGNVIIAGQEIYDIVERQMEAGVLYSGIRHPERNDVYEESERILTGGRESAARLRRTVRFLQKEGFPRHLGLFENNVILRRHNDPQVRRFDEFWMGMLVNYSQRDQMSQTYCLWKTGLPYEYLLPEGFSTRNHPAFKYVPHGPVYVKDRSLRGRISDARIALRELCYRLWLKCRLSGR